MKFLFALALLGTMAAFARGQTEPWCRCGAFISRDWAEEMVYELPEIPIETCEDKSICKNVCIKQLNEESDYGNLWYVLEDGLTIGQKICSYLMSHFHFFVHNHKVYGYYEVCGGAWRYAGFKSEQSLCCEGGQHKHCISRED